MKQILSVDRKQELLLLSSCVEISLATPIDLDQRNFAPSGNLHLDLKVGNRVPFAATLHVHHHGGKQVVDLECHVHVLCRDPMYLPPAKEKRHDLSVPSRMSSHHLGNQPWDLWEAVDQVMMPEDPRFHDTLKLLARMLRRDDGQNVVEAICHEVQCCTVKP